MAPLWNGFQDPYDAIDLMEAADQKVAERLLAADPDDGIMHLETMSKLKAIADASQADIELDKLLDEDFKTVAR